MATLEDALKLIGATTDLDTLRKIRLEATKAIKRHRMPKAVMYHFSAWSMQLAQGLWLLVQERYPFAQEPNLSQWADDIDKLNRLDNYQTDLIRAVLQWSQKDPFWRQQVRSGSNLRKHFNSMLVRIKEERAGRGGVTI